VESEDEHGDTARLRRKFPRIRSETSLLFFGNPTRLHWPNRQFNRVKTPGLRRKAIATIAKESPGVGLSGDE
jgi:hypothetical protein